MPFRTRKNPNDLLKSVLEQDATLKESMQKQETFEKKQNEENKQTDVTDVGGSFKQPNSGLSEDLKVSEKSEKLPEKESDEPETVVGEKVRQELMENAVTPPALMGKTLDEQAKNAEKILSEQEDELPSKEEVYPLSEQTEEAEKNEAAAADIQEESSSENEVEKTEALIQEETQVYQEAYSEEMNEDLPSDENKTEKDSFYVENQEPDNLNAEEDSFVEDIPVLSTKEVSPAFEKKNEEELNIPHLPAFLNNKPVEGEDFPDDETFVPSSKVVSSFEADEEDEIHHPEVIDDRPSVRFELPKAIMYEKENTYSFSFGRGQEVFSEANELKTIRLENAGQSYGYSLKDWNLVIVQLQLIPLEHYAGQVYDLPKDGVHGGLLVGPKQVVMPITNPAEIDVPNSFDFPLSETKKGHFLLGALGFQSSKDWGLALNTMKVINLDNKWGETLSFNGESGMLIGPENSVLYFFNLKQLILPYDEQPKEEHFYPENMIISPVKNSAFYLDETQENQALEGTLERSVIVVQTDSTAYGWHVVFENGADMNLLDVCEYQRRNHYLPDAAGMIYFGEKEFSFSKITQIQMYTKTQYTGYTG
jgi:hypothetical protein